MVCLDPHTPTLLALERMKEVAGVSGAAVVPPQTGCIIANLSLSDMRLITPEHFSVLALPVAEFLALLHNTSYLGYSQKASNSGSHPFFAQGPRSVGGDDQDEVPLFSCSKASTLHEVLHVLADNSVHRVYVVDHDARPNVIGVITPTDLLRWISSQGP
ncbi:hypothetical protein DUNSADRAFT_11094 [Dunaliella salina]|uniref:CBS domain-containing protein n=1 Tax=Dunaliella salina TaxID=3046 RepID=A0ABQ7H4I3_DUNSA|nr:hypothetical protein DUNSADRAFT_11094 [Dunaliella salina]|eukprot:KAF5841778.1 hypothetical protein DUNSADRAFT_11094 [Dunaliella salina]